MSDSQFDIVSDAVKKGGAAASLIPETLVPAPRTAKGRLRVTEIKQAGRVIFERDGYSATRVSDIAAEAALSTGAFYRYFDDKKNLALVLLDEFLYEYRDYIRVPFKPEKPLASIEASNVRYLEFYQKNVDLMKLLIEGSHLDDDIRRLWLSSAGEVYGRMARLLRRCSDLGILRADVAIEVAAPLLGGMIEQYAYLTYVHGAHYIADPLEAAAQITDIWVAGVLERDNLK